MSGILLNPRPSQRTHYVRVCHHSHLEMKLRVRSDHVQRHTPCTALSRISSLLLKEVKIQACFSPLELLPLPRLLSRCRSHINIRTKINSVCSDVLQQDSLRALRTGQCVQE